MGYGVRDLACMKNRICVSCKKADAGKYRRCILCRAKLAARKPRKVRVTNCNLCGKRMVGRAFRCRKCKEKAAKERTRIAYPKKPSQMSYVEWKRIRSMPKEAC